MVCFCKNTASALGQMLPSIGATADLDLSFNAAVQAIADSLTNSGLAAGPWSPHPSWSELQLPSVPLSASEVATISAAAYLRAQVLAQSGMDLLVPAQANAFVRLAATLSARLSEIAASHAEITASSAAMAASSAAAGTGAGAEPGSGPAAWPQLAAALSAISRVDAALTNGVPASPSSLQPSASMASWQQFLAQVQHLLPFTTLSTQLGLDTTTNFSAQLSARVQTIANLPMPQVPVPTFSLMATLSASLTAIAQLSASLGINPLQAGVPAVQAMVAQRSQAVAQLAMSHGCDLNALAASLPNLPATPNPPSLVTGATVNAVMGLNAEALASLDMPIPAAASLPVLTVGMPMASLAAQLSAMGFPAATAPCGSICDAGSLLNATLSGSGSA